ncbi:MAG: alpha amylase N-terminal ig-like domain-containing protein [Clostridiaceae bacterium]
MNERAILHIPNSQFCFPIGEKEIVLRIRVSNEDNFKGLWVIHGYKYDYSFKREETKMDIKYRDRLYSYYEVKLKVADVRFAYIFKIEEEERILYYSEDGISESYDFKLSFYNFFQLPYINQADLFETVDWMRNAVFYQIFIDRFRRGDLDKEDSYINLKWGDIPNPKSFAGGDLKGIGEKLDYLKSLGITAIYLTPLFQSVSNHKYDTIDYKKVDSQFGSNDVLKELIEEIHNKGMKIVLDAVFNHCSMYMKEFQDVLEKGRASKYFHWFLIDGDKPHLEAMNYQCFASCNYMPKLNTSNPEVQQFLLDVTAFWTREFKIDGWRLDVSDEVSHDFWRVFRKEVKSINESCVIIGENWHDAYPYLMGDQYDSIMNYSFTKAALDFFAKGALNSKEMAERLNSLLMRNKEQVNRMMLNLLDSHDTHRFFTEVNKDKDKVLAALAIEMVYLGAPCIYYGTEIALEGGYDPDSRRCFNWDEEQWDKGFMERIREMISLRALDEVMFGDIAIYEENNLLCLKRSYEGKELLLLINNTDEAVEFNDVSSLKKRSSIELVAKNNIQDLKIGAKGYAAIRLED